MSPFVAGLHREAENGFLVRSLRWLAAGLVALTALETAAASSRVESLLRRMTLEEKVGQLIQLAADQKELPDALATGAAGSILNTTGARQANDLQRLAIEGSRLRVPLLFAHDVIHGYRTIFPIPLALACSWDVDLVEQTAQAAARETRAAGIHWTFAPMVDIGRDPRWGRVAEGQGEDPFLASALARAYVRGFQSEGVLATAKHFVGYGAAAGGRDYGETEISEGTLRELYLPPFRAAADAGVATFMTAFNTVDRVPATASPHLLKDILRREWRYPGLVVSDWASVAELINHGVAATPEEAARKAMAAGVDIDMWDRAYLTLVDSVRSGKVREREIDEAVRRVLTLKERAGVFERPYADVSREEPAMLLATHRALARRAAQRSIVLLKNDGVLPLPREGRKIAVVGALAGSRADLLGPWAASGKPEETTTIIEVLKERNIHHSFALGTGVKEGSDEELLRAVELARENDVVIAVLGEERDMSGEAASRSQIGLPDRQQLLVDMLAATGKRVVLVVLSGRPLAIPRAAERVRGLVQAWFPGTEGANAIVDVLFGDVSPTAKLAMTVPRSEGQIPITYAKLPSGRPAHAYNRYSNKYQDLQIEPLYPFGFGLSYTTFEYSDLKTSAAAFPMSGRISVSATIRNSGARAGEEIVQLYVRDRVASVSRPVRELKGFRRIALEPGESTRVEFSLTSSDLQFWSGRSWTVEPGAFDVWIAPDSASGLHGTFELTR